MMQQTDLPRGATPLDPEEMAGLKLRHITARGELNRWEQENISEAMDWLDKRKNKTEILAEEFIKKLHEKMFYKVWTWAGSFRRSKKNIGVDWTRIGVDLRQLLDDVQYWIEHKTYPADEIAARFHHRLVFIHPFTNGNGRHSRLMADILLADVLGQKPFTWGNGDLIAKGNVRNRYVDALILADRQDYSKLLEFVRS
jgi:Fic-DOC domain mobile mystery protein B